MDFLAKKKIIMRICYSQW